MRHSEHFFAQKTMLCAALSILCGLNAGITFIGLGNVLVDIYPCLQGLIPVRAHTWKITTLTSIMPFGALLGGIIVGMITKYWDSIIILRLGGACYLGAMLSLTQRSYSIQLLSRLLSGLGMGFTNTVGPSMVIEAAPVNSRGSLGGLIQNSFSVGVCLSAVLSYVILGKYRDFHADKIYEKMLQAGDAQAIAFRLLQWLMIAPIVVALLLNLLVFSSQIRCLSLPLDEKIEKLPSLEQRDDHFSLSISYQPEGPEEPTQTGLFKRTKVRLGLFRQWLRPLTIVVVGGVAPQLLGINALMIYFRRFMEDSGVSYIALGSIVFGVMKTFFSVLALTLMDRIGRRTMLISSISAMTLSMFAFFLQLKLTSWSVFKNKITFLLLAVYLCGFEVGPGSHFWLLNNEILPTSMVRQGFALVSVLFWSSGACVTFLFPPLYNVLGPWVFFIFALLGSCCATFYYFCLPETMRRSKVEISHELSGSHWIVS